MDSGHTAIDRNGAVMKRKVQREPEFTANGNDTVNNISPIDAADVPSICRAVGRFDEDLVRGSVICCDRNGLIQVSEKALNTNCFMVASCCLVEAKTKGFTHLLKP